MRDQRDAIRRLMTKMCGRAYIVNKEIRMPTPVPWMTEGVRFRLLGMSKREDIFRANVIGHEDPFNISFTAVRNLETRGDIEEEV